MIRTVTRTAAIVEANVHEHIARAMYYFSVHLLFASIVGSAAWVLTSIRGASATTKYWLWVVTGFNFVVPAGAVIDKLRSSGSRECGWHSIARSPAMNCSSSVRRDKHWFERLPNLQP